MARPRGNGKYRAQTRSRSDGDDIRWYFSKDFLQPHEVAASFPRTEVVGNSDYFRFSEQDSLALEAAFLEHEEELVFTWWKEYGECSEGPSMDRVNEISNSEMEVQALTKHIDDSKTCFKRPSHNNHFYEGDDEAIGVLVKGGLYEVDLWRRRCYPVYWSGEHRRVLRGHWFAQKGGLDWLPFREDISEHLETAFCRKVWHHRKFQPFGDFAARVDLQGASQGLYALFVGEDDTWEAWLGVDASGLSSVLGLRGASMKIRRGFALSESSQPTEEELHQRKEEEMDDYCSQVPVRHLVFVVHGIGQRLHNANLVDDVIGFRHATLALSEQHLSAYQRNNQRILFIPCQWRRGLKLAGEAAVENCTLEGVRALRTMLSATSHDILYYMSPVYCQDIIDSVSIQLNKLYSKFIKRNPGYDGKVSIYGHSLGSVLSYDILCHQETLVSPFPIEQVNLSIPTLKDDDIIDNECAETRKYDTGLVYGRDLSLERGPTIDADAQECCNSEHDETNRKEIELLKDEVAVLREKLRVLNKVNEDESHSITPSGRDDIVCNDDDKFILKRQAVIGVGETTSFQKKECVGKDVHHPKARSGSRKHYTPYIEYTKLLFEVDTFFAVGSPLGVFLALRNVRLGMGMGKNYWHDINIEEEMPACRCMLNIFHPYDPVAYRIEPLICKEYLDIKPFLVPYHKGGKRLHIHMQELSAAISVQLEAFVDSLSMVGTRLISLCSSSQEDEEGVPSENEELLKERSYGSLMMERLSGHEDGRIDFMLQGATFEHQYLQALSSHTSYWQDPDTVLLIVKHLYRDIPKEPPKSHLESSFKNMNNDKLGIDLETSKKLLESESDSGEEEVGFTFCKNAIADFIATEKDLQT